MPTMPTTARDRPHLARAIELAEQGRGRTSPNPMVGAVLVCEDTVLAEGWHSAHGAPHAETEAIAAAGAADLRGATLYVSLEPCCHTGTTPPCTEAILRAGIGRVVVASDDPSAHAAGRGPGILRDEGVVVDWAGDDLAARARRLNQPFRKHARIGRPWVLYKSAMTLDGKVATERGDSKWISGPDSRRRVHQWRAECDAVAVGVGTALADDPRLTARPSLDGAPADEPPSGVRQPRRVVFDSLARLPLEGKLARAAPETSLTVVTSRAAPRGAVAALQGAGAQIIVASGQNEPARVRSALDQLGAAGVRFLLLEGGPRLAGAFLDAGELDELRLFIAPLLLGGRAARDPIEGQGAELITEAVRAQTLRCESVGEDLLIHARLCEW
jgi:diaminohydroxyphosphoribosylaminopyrimidine deaminase/5-amino-6-(5-phosphoribosylamino)uracil reductase